MTLLLLLLLGSSAAAAPPWSDDGLVEMWTHLDLETSYTRRTHPSRIAERDAALDAERAYRPEPEPGPGAFEAPARAPRRGPRPAAGSRRAVALTFDTEIPYGVEARHTLASVLDILDATRVTATFFVVGHWAEANPKVLRRLVADGHEIANHSLTHRRFVDRRPQHLGEELDAVAEIVLRETGAPIAPLFRPPYGCIDEPAARIVRDRGYQLVGWTASGQDARRTTESADEVLASVERNLRDGDIILLHTNRWITAAALPRILLRLHERNLKPVSVSELFRVRPSLGPARTQHALRRCGSPRVARAPALPKG